MSIDIWILSSSLTIKHENLSKAYSALENDQELASWFSFNDLKDRNITEFLKECGIEPVFNETGDLIEITLLGETISHHELIFSIITSYVETKSEVIIGIETEEDWVYADIYQYKNKKLKNFGKQAAYNGNELILKNIKKQTAMTPIPVMDKLIVKISNISNQAFSISKSNPTESNATFKQAIKIALNINKQIDWEGRNDSLGIIAYYFLLSEKYEESLEIYNIICESEDSFYKEKVLSRYKDAINILKSKEITIPGNIITYINQEIDNFKNEDSYFLEEKPSIKQQKEWLLESCGGTTNKQCQHEKCANKQLNGFNYCIDHLYDSGVRR